VTFQKPVIPGLHPDLGRTIGMFAVDGDAAFDWFDYREA